MEADPGRWLSKHRELFETVYHRDCNAVIDAQSVAHCMFDPEEVLSDTAEIVKATRSLFEKFRQANITAYVMFQMETFDPDDSEANLKPRNKIQFKKTEIIFQTTLRELQSERFDIHFVYIPSHLVFSHTMVLFARNLNALLISASFEFHLYDVPRGFMRTQVHSDPLKRNLGCSGKTYLFKNLKKAINADKSLNILALSMWATVLTAKTLFQPFLEPFMKKERSVDIDRIRFMPLLHRESSPGLWNMLTFLRDNTPQDAMRAILDTITKNKGNAMRSLKAGTTIANDTIGLNVSLEMEHYAKMADPPEWLKCHILKWGLRPLDFSERSIHRLSSLRYQDSERPSIHEDTKHLRRIFYAMISDKYPTIREFNDGEYTVVKPMKTIIKFYVEQNETITVKAPKLEEIVNLCYETKLSMMCRSLYVKPDFMNKIMGRNWILLILKFWFHNADRVVLRDLQTALLTAALVQNKHSIMSNIFSDRLEFRTNDENCKLSQAAFRKISKSELELKRLHPQEQISECISNAAKLNRALMSPFGEEFTQMDVFFSDLVFHNVSKYLEDFSDEQIYSRELFETKHQEDIFREAVDLIVDKSDVDFGQEKNDDSDTDEDGGDNDDSKESLEILCLGEASLDIESMEDTSVDDEDVVQDKRDETFVVIESERKN